MGIPKFFRWLTRRYPLILQNIRREEESPPIDNLYLDLNGIVHNCIHGNDSKRHERVSQLDDFEEVWANIMKAIDEIVHTVKPRKILFLAVDGVAPRAKMNQQRARRFRSAKDAMMLREQLEGQGKEAPDLFDSNAISPGTNFMSDLSKQLDFFVQYKLNTDPLYQKLQKVVLSDSSVPGEGEHKMMDYVRQAKLDPSYDPNTRHCFYGADADLIMLSLITHEPHFMILREEHIVKKIKQGGVQRLDLQRTQNFQLIHISLLREYLQLEYSEIAPQMKMRFDLERIIDDFVFFCFFIGNDFLPSLSALDISEGSLDQLIDFYKICLPTMTDYITSAGKVYWDRAQPFIQMLGQHEHEVFKNRINQMERPKERIVSWDREFNQAHGAKDKATLLKSKLQQKLFEKKKLKIQALTMKNSAKQFKKYLLLKKFAEDDLAALNPVQQKQREDLILKYKTIRERQYESEKEALIDEKQEETLTDIISGIKEEYFSDLQPTEIPDEHVSDVNESELDISSLPDVENTPELESKLAVATELIDKYQEENAEFMKEFVKEYAVNPDAAKAKYYEKKLGFEVKSDSGYKKKGAMLKKYLEGLQWVLYYYYKGVQHWRWYYPYHYAPMISDIGDNIVKDILHGQNNIEIFEKDYNCSEVNHPYTPFQQLLSILPTKSIHLLPAEYKHLAVGILEKYFPSDFDIDLNGRTLPWEAICLIPFVDEDLFLDNEKNVKPESLNDSDKVRNQITFAFKCYVYDKQRLESQPKVPLQSSLPQLSGLKYNYVTLTYQDEYKDVGKHSFSSKLHQGVQAPCCDFPSFKWLSVNSFEYDTKVVNGVPMKRLLVKIPSCFEETSPEIFEKYVYNFCSSSQKELYVNFPFMNEAFPTVFEDQDFVYQIYGDAYTGNYRVHKQPQNMTVEEFDSFKTRTRIRMADKGISIGDAQTFAIVSRVTDVQYDSHQGVYYKIYSEEQERIPFNMVMRRRDTDHYQNVNQRVAAYHLSLQCNKEVVCLNMHLFGVVGELAKVDAKKNQVKVHFDKETEQQKIHDPFLGQNVLSNKDTQATFQQENMKRFYTDAQIEQDLNLRQGIVNRLTGSFLVSFIDKEKGERVVFDLGLNIKNYTKKVHIPDYVRYVAEEDYLADNQYDTYHHNFHARGAKHVRKHWEYSQDCYDIIKEYYEKYKEVIFCLARTLKDNKQMNTLKDLYKGVDTEEATAKVKEIAHWIESLPISQLPYVEMGFDALSTDIIEKLDSHKDTIKSQYQPIQLNVKDSELLQLHMVYQECFPFWSPPYTPKTVTDFRVGDRVMNINSIKREYIPFGLRGTVIGKTNEKVIILFDEQFLTGSNIYGHCKDYRGGQVDPAHLLNLTKKFQTIIKKNSQIAQQFQEQPAGGIQYEEEKKDAPKRIVSYQQKEQQNQRNPAQSNLQQQQQPQQFKQQQQQYQQKPYEPKKQQYQPKKQEQQQQQQYIRKDQAQPQQQFVQPVLQQQPLQQQYTQPIQEQPQQPIETSQQEQQYQEQQQPKESGLNMHSFDNNLANNADFQQLLSMVGLAQQMQGFQLFNPEVTGSSTVAQADTTTTTTTATTALNVNSNAFVPQHKKSE